VPRRQRKEYESRRALEGVPHAVRFLMFPEDLGVAPFEHPASIWQLAEILKLEETNMVTAALFQEQFGAVTPKSTRILTDARNMCNIFKEGWPTFNEGRYVGPLPSPSAGSEGKVASFEKRSIGVSFMTTTDGKVGQHSTKDVMLVRCPRLWLAAKVRSLHLRSGR
jgi:hypothetical protein